MAEKIGRFGIHGGQYIPETLMQAIEELDKAYTEAKADPAFQKELCRTALPPVLCGEDDEGSWRRQDLLKKRGLKPHRSPQNQQCFGTGFVGEAYGKDQTDCGNRSRTTRCGNGNGSSPFRHGMCGFHGAGGH